MANLNSETSKPPATQSLHILNLSIAVIAGIISIVGGLYSLKTNVFAPKTGSLQGVVMDERIAKPLMSASVEVSETNGAVVATGLTDSDGRYILNSLREGDYLVKAIAPRHQVSSKAVKIYKGAGSNINFELVPEEEKMVRNTEVSSAPVPIIPAQYPGYVQPSSQTVPNPEYPRRSSRRKRTPATYTTPPDETSSYAGQGSNSNNTLTQVLGQLVQSYVSKKTDNSQR